MLNSPLKRIWLARGIRLTLLLIALGVAIGLIVSAFNDNIVFFFSPSEIKAKPELLSSGQKIRVGGIVVEGSIHHIREKNLLKFKISDLEEELQISYHGIIPSLFKENQGVVALGKLDENSIFQADEILAKHDENYMPKEVADSIKKSGQWKE